MIGLKYICTIFHVQLKDIGEELGVSKQTVNSWTSKSRKIPNKHLECLSKRFGISKEYFQKELDEEDEIIIQDIKLNQKIESILIEDTDKQGNKYIKRIDDPYGIREYSMLNKTRIRGIKTLKEIRKQLLGDEQTLEENMGEEIKKIEDITEVYKKISAILQSEKISTQFIERILHNIINIYDIKTEDENIKRGFGETFGRFDENDFDIRFKELLKER